MARRTTLRLRVVPGATRPAIVGRHGDAWKVRVAANAERGQANAAVLELLASTLALPRRNLVITAGRSSRDKLVALEGVTPDAVEERLSAAADGVR